MFTRSEINNILQNNRYSCLKDWQEYLLFTGMERNGCSPVSVGLICEIKAADVIHTCAHISKECICQCNGCHGFDYNNCSWNDDRIVAAVDFQRKRFFVFGDGLLWLADGRGWLDVGTEDNFAAIADAAHDTACVVGGFDNLTVFNSESVIVCGTV